MAAVAVCYRWALTNETQCVTLNKMVKVKDLVWDEWNVDHIAKHRVTPVQVEIALKDKQKKVLKTYQQRLLTVVLAPESKQQYYVVTARDMSKKEDCIVMTRKRKIPKFKSVKEEARFWDTHDITDYLAETKPVDVVFEPSVHKKATLTIRLQSKLKHKLNNVARDYGIPTSTLTRMWIVDKLKHLHSA